MARYKGLNVGDEVLEAIEERAEIHEFPGGCFVVVGNEVDCFVVPEMRGKWASRSLLRKVVGGVVKKHGKAIARIHRDNGASLELALRLGFECVGINDAVYTLECRTWKL